MLRRSAPRRLPLPPLLQYTLHQAGVSAMLLSSSSSSTRTAHDAAEHTTLLSPCERHLDHLVHTYSACDDDVSAACSSSSSASWYVRHSRSDSTCNACVRVCARAVCWLLLRLFDGSVYALLLTSAAVALCACTFGHYVRGSIVEAACMRRVRAPSRASAPVATTHARACASRSGHAACSTTTTTSAATTHTPVLLVSACLLGYAVTYRAHAAAVAAPLMTTIATQSSRQQPPRQHDVQHDVRLRGSDGSNKAAQALHVLVHELWRRRGEVVCVPVCPEVQLLHLPTPRPAMRLTTTRTTTTTTTMLCHARGCASPPSSSVCRGVCVDADATLTLRTRDTAVLTYTSRNVRSCALAHATTRTTPQHNSSCSNILPTTTPQLLQLLQCGAYDGAVLKARSPSCGVDDARCYVTRDGGGGGGSDDDDATHVRHSGFFAQMLQQQDDEGDDETLQQQQRRPCDDDTCRVRVRRPIVTERTLWRYAASHRGDGEVSGGGGGGDVQDAVMAFVQHARAHCAARMHALP